MYVCCLGGLDDFLTRNLSAVVPIGDVVGDADPEQNRLLEDDAHLQTQPVHVQISHFHVVNFLKYRWKIGEWCYWLGFWYILVNITGK